MSVPTVGVTLGSLKLALRLFQTDANSVNAVVPDTIEDLLDMSVDLFPKHHKIYKTVQGLSHGQPPKMARLSLQQVLVETNDTFVIIEVFSKDVAFIITPDQGGLYCHINDLQNLLIVLEEDRKALGCSADELVVKFKTKPIPDMEISDILHLETAILIKRGEAL